MANAFIDKPEIIQIEKCHHHHDLSPARISYRLLHALQQQIVVGEFRQSIVVILMLELFFIVFGFGDVIHYADKMRDLACFVAHWRDIQIVPEWAAVFPEIAEYGMPFVLFPECREYLPYARLLMLVSQQKTPVSPCCVRRCIAGNLKKGGVDVFDWIVWLGATGNNNGVHA